MSDKRSSILGCPSPEAWHHHFLSALEREAPHSMAEKETSARSLLCCSNRQGGVTDLSSVGPAPSRVPGTPGHAAEPALLFRLLGFSSCSSLCHAFYDPTQQRRQDCYYPYFKDEQTETQKNKVSYPKACSHSVPALAFERRSEGLLNLCSFPEFLALDCMITAFLLFSSTCL